MAIPIEQRLNLELEKTLKASLMEGGEVIDSFNVQITGIDRRYVDLTKVGVVSTRYRFPRRMVEGRRQIGRLRFEELSEEEQPVNPVSVLSS